MTNTTHTDNSPFVLLAMGVCVMIAVGVVVYAESYSYAAMCRAKGGHVVHRAGKACLRDADGLALVIP